MHKCTHNVMHQMHLLVEAALAATGAGRRSPSEVLAQPQGLGDAHVQVEAQSAHVEQVQEPAVPAHMAKQ